MNLNPQLQIGITADLLTRIFQSLLPAQVPCPDTTHLTDDLFLITDVAITEAVAFRGDETTLQDVNGMSARDTLLALVQLFPLAAPDGSGPYPGWDSVHPAGRASFPVPRTFLLVSGSLVAIQVGQLSSAHTSDAGTLLVFDRQAAKPQPNFGETLPPLLFSVDILPLSGPKGARLHFEFVSLFDSTIDQDLVVGAVNSQMQSSIPPKDVDLPFDTLISQTSPLAFAGLTKVGVNVGLTTDPWRPPATREPPRPLKGGLRIGLDFTLPDSIDEWKSFYALDPWHPTMLENVADIREDLSIGIEGTFISVTLAALMENYTSQVSLPDTFIQFRIGTPGVDLAEGGIQVQLPIGSGDLGAGDIFINITPSVVQQPADSLGTIKTFLSVQTCLVSNISVGAQIFAWFFLTFLSNTLDPVLPGFVSLAAPVFWGVLDGLLPGLLNSAIGSPLASFAVPSSFQCAAPDPQNCRVCRTLGEFTIDQFGQLTLTNFRVRGEGIGATFSVAPKGALLPAQLSVQVSEWEYVAKPCHPLPLDPSKRIVLKNVGGLPLKICLVDQDDHHGAQPKVLHFSPSIHEIPNVPDRVIPPGASLPITVVAAVTGNADYNQLRPPSLWMRVITSGGAVELDLNQPPKSVSGRPDKSQPPSYARTLDPARQRAENTQRSLICAGLHEAMINPLWQYLNFPDPGPFDMTDQVIERVDLAFAAQRGAILEGFDQQGRILARAPERDGQVTLSLTAMRAPAEAHSRSNVSFRTNSAFAMVHATALGLGTAYARSPLAPSTPGIQRSLYRKRRTIGLGAQILNAALLDSALAVLTRSELRIAPISEARLGAWNWLAIDEPRALDARGDTLAVISRRGVTIYDRRMVEQHDLETDAKAVTVDHTQVWIARPHELLTLQRADGAWKVTRQLPLSGIDQLMSAGPTVYGLCAGEVWLVSQPTPARVGLVADSLVPLGENVAAVADDSVFVLDSTGRVIAQHEPLSWLTRVLHLPYLAIEVRKTTGTLTFYDHYISTMDLEGIPIELRRMVADALLS